MIKQYMYFFVAALALSIVGCQTEKDTNAAEELGIENAKDSIEWAGTYEGKLPCDDCPGIETTLVLNEDGSYELSENYIDGEEENNNGQFSWESDNSTIQLNDNTDRMYVIGEGTVYVLDEDGNLVRGEMEDQYQLTKVSSENVRASNTNQEETNEMVYKDEDGNNYEVTFYEEDGKKYAKVKENGEVNVLPLESTNEYRNEDFTLVRADDESTLTWNGKDIRMVSTTPMTYHYERGDEEIWIAYHNSASGNYVNVTHDGNNWRLPQTDEWEKGGQYEKGDVQWKVIDQTGIFTNGKDSYEFLVKK